MNKLFTKIATLIAGLSMAIGVGVAVSNGRDATRVDATISYSQLTSIASIDESAQYVLGVEGYGSGKGFHKSGTSSWGACTTSDSETPLYYTLKKGNNNANFTAETTISGTTYYLQVPTSNTFSMSTNSTAANTTLIIGTTQVSGTNYAVANSSTKNRHLRVNGTSGLRSYAGTTGSMAFFYKVVSGGGDTPTPTTYTVTYNANGGSGTMTDSNSPYNSGATVTVLNNSFTRDGYDFVNWNTSADGKGTDYNAGATFAINANTTLYAQWEEQSLGDNVDVLNYAFTGLSGSSYQSWSGKIGTSGAVYSGQSCAGVSFIQIRSQNPSGIVTTTSGGIAKNIKVTWGGSNSNGRYLTIFGKNTAYTQPSDLYDSSKKGTSAGTITFSTGNANGSVNLSGDYQYIGILSSGAMYMTSIEITWEASSKTLSSISLGGTYETNFTVGDTFNHTGMTVTANYSDSTSANVTSSATWSSPDMSSAGQKTVTVSYTESGATKTADYTITVSAPSTPFITPAKDSTNGYTGQNETLSFTYGNLSGSLSVTSSNTSVVTVGTPSINSGSGSVKINFVGAGDTTVKFLDGSTERASVSVSVTASSVTITGLAASSTAYIGKTLNLGSTITVTATGIYSNAVTWESEDDDIATVSAAGVVTGVAEGTVDITVTSDDYPSATMTCSVTVTEQPLQYVINFGSTKNTNPTEIKNDASFKSTWSGNDISDVTVGDFSKIYGVSSSQLKCGSGSATASISFTIPSDSYIVAVEVVVETAGGTSMNVVSGATGAQTENQTIAAGTLTFDDYLANEKSNYVLITSTASGAFYLSSITINYANFAAELTASPSSFDVAVNTSQDVTLTPNHFTPTSYTAVVKSGSSLTASAVAFNNNTATITAGSTVGATVFTITGTGGGKNASVDVTVNVTKVRNLTALTITTVSDKTSFKVGDTFDVGSLVITATFDDDPTTVVYSKANGNLSVLTASPAIGYEFQESDIGNNKTASFGLNVGTGDLSVNYNYNVVDKTYATKVTDVQDLWDGQQIYFGDSEGTRVNIAHAGGNQLGSQEAVVHSTKGLCVDNLAHDGAYTVHREKIDSVIYYSFVKDGYYLEASNTTNNYLTRTDTLSDNCRYTISITNGEVTMTNKGNSDKPQFRWNSGSNWFSQYQSGSTMDKAVIYAINSYSEESVANAFVERYLHMDENVSGQCNTYYPLLKPVWAAMGDLEKVSVSGAAYDRLQAWADAHGEHLDSNMDIVANSRINFIGNVTQNSSAVAVIIVMTIISTACIGGYFFLRKRKEEC